VSTISCLLSPLSFLIRWSCLLAQQRFCVSSMQAVYALAEIDYVSYGLVRYEERAHDGATSSNQPREYEEIVKMVYDKDRTTVEVDFKHVLNFDDDLADRIKVCACVLLRVSVFMGKWNAMRVRSTCAGHRQTALNVNPDG